MLIDYSDGRLEEARKFADSRGIREKLEKRLEYLDKYACQEDCQKTKCCLYRDFAPNSFYFVMEIKKKDGQYERWFNGGLIYYGKGDSGVSDPQFSVRIGETDEDWLVNT